MCGITGFIEHKASRTQQAISDTARAMIEVLHHRGPDGHGIWADASSGIAFGHARLSIIDLSSAGNQPMLSRSGRFVITFNGEVYNYKEIRQKLEAEGVAFSGHSDTEVLLEGIATWGVEKTVKQCIGMFAFAVWDKESKRLVLVRDRLGVKPLYYAKTGQSFLFASQSGSFHKHPDFKPRVAEESLAGYLQYGYLPRSQSIYQDVSQVLPAHMVTLHPDGNIEQQAYWQLPSEIIAIGEEEATERLEQLLESAISLRMRSDVPLGAFISGGVDSSVVVALMQKMSGRPIKTFCVGFEDKTFDESHYAKAVANHLGTDHTEIIMKESDMLELVPSLPNFYDEPFADFSMLPTMLVSRLARQQVTVSLSGDGGDELFAGYPKYHIGQQLERTLKLPRALRQTASLALKKLPTALIQKMGKVAGIKITPQRIARLLSVLQAKTPDELLLHFYEGLWPFGDLPLNNPAYRKPQVKKYVTTPLRNATDMQRVDVGFYLIDDIMTKVDRASMAYGLEAREPLLDHRLVEFAFSLPTSYKLRGKQTKYLLRKVLYKHVPPALIERPKQGFTPPLHRWLRGPLRDWAEDLLAPQKLASDGFFNPQEVQQLWQQHLSGKLDNTMAVWSILMFQQWKEKYRISI